MINKHMHTNDITLKNRLALIQSFPCFAVLTRSQSKEFAQLFREISLSASQLIVKEDDLIDCIYIIESGDAEVTHQAISLKRKREIPVATLTAGDAIGLSDSGFYSTSGKRTASVTALTDMLLLRLDIKDLYLFLQKHHLELAMSAASLQMLRMRLIKQSLPFSKLSHERLMWLANHVEEITVLAGVEIFHQGDKGESCYLIRQGEVEILHEGETGTRTIALLKPPTLFGEATLLTHSVRNATARAKSPCDLLVLNYEKLLELLETENNVANMFMGLMVDRSMPLQNSDVSMHTRKTVDGHEITILKNAKEGKYFKLSEEGTFIWEQLDGKKTLQDITLKLAAEKNVFAPDMVAALISKLTHGGFISNISIDEYQPNQPWWRRTFYAIKRTFKVRYAFGDADEWITKYYQRFIHYLFTPIAAVILAVSAALGLVAFIVAVRPILDFFSIKHLYLLLILGLIPLGLLAATLHELAHAFAVKSFGREVHYIGVGWDWLRPVAFTDTSDMWLATRKPRMLVNFAGVFADVIMAGIASILIWCIANPYIQGMLWLFALYNYIRAIRMLSPLQEMDGYYLLMDWVEKTKLKQSAMLWLIKIFPKCLTQPSYCRGYWPEKSYWLACCLYLICITMLTFLVQYFVLDALNITVINRYLTLLLPFFVLVSSSVSIVFEIKNQRDE